MYIHKLNLKKTKFMNKMIMNRLTMLAVTLMASMACFAQGKMATTIESGKQVDDVFDYLELKYKVLDNAAGYTVEVIGFADAFVADPSQFDKAEEGVEIKTHNTVTISHIIGESDKVEVKTYIARVVAGALNTNDATLASKVTALEIDYSDDEMATAPVIIGENAFAGLTYVATVKSLSPTPPTCPEGAFASSVKTLIVPEGSKVMGLYAKPNAKAWRKITTIKNTAGLMFGDVDKDRRVRSGDLTTLQQVIQGQKPSNDACDADGDGRVRSGDLTTLQREIQGNYR